MYTSRFNETTLVYSILIHATTDIIKVRSIVQDKTETTDNFVNRRNISNVGLHKEFNYNYSNYFRTLPTCVIKNKFNGHKSSSILFFILQKFSFFFQELYSVSTLHFHSLLPRETEILYLSAPINRRRGRAAPLSSPNLLLHHFFLPYSPPPRWISSTRQSNDWAPMRRRQEARMESALTCSTSVLQRCAGAAEPSDALHAAPSATPGNPAHQRLVWSRKHDPTPSSEGLCVTCYLVTELRRANDAFNCRQHLRNGALLLYFS